MNLASFIAKGITSSSNKSFSRLIVKVAIGGVALSIAVMILSLTILKGFKTEIKEKVIGFGGHIQLTNFDLNRSLESNPINADTSIIKEIKEVKGVRHIQAFSNKPGIIKTDDNVEGIVLKGIGSDFDWSFFKKNLVKGDTIKIGERTSSDIIISNHFAKKLELDTGDGMVVYFMQQPIRARKFNIVGIYETGMSEFDRVFGLCDIRQIQKLNGWDSTMVGGYEILLGDFKELDTTAEKINLMVGLHIQTYTIKDMNQQLFTWLDWLDVNVFIIISLMIFVSTINMITALLVLILERTTMIGILKALGSSNKTIKWIFIYKAANLIGKGLLWGNVIGIGISLLQKYTHIMPLDQNSYYVSYVPIDIVWWQLAILNIGALVITLLAMFIPVILVTKTTPVKAIRFD